MAVFGTYETIKKNLLKKTDNKYKLPIFFLSAMLGDLAGSIILTPGEIIKQKVQSGIYKTQLSAIVGIFKRHGFLGFYQGYLSLIARDIPYRAIQLPLYEYLYEKIYHKESVNNIKPHQAAIIGCISGMVGAGITNPIDVITPFTI